MAITIQVRRGTKAQLDLIALAEGEIGYTTDTKQVFIGVDGVVLGAALSPVGGIISAASLTPFDTSKHPVGTLFLVVGVATGEDSTLYVSTGAEWEKTGVNSLSELSGTLDDIADGHPTTGYSKVSSTEITGGNVTQINDGSNVVTAAQARTHIDDATLHRIINDGGTSTTELWSADKITTELSLVSSGTGSALHIPVQDIAELEALDTLNTGSEVEDKMLCHVEDKGLFRFDLESTDGVVTDDVIRPTDRASLDGRWIRMTDPTNFHNTLSGLNVGDFQHLTAAEKTKFDCIEAGAEVNQTIGGGDGVTITPQTGDNVLIESDFEEVAGNLGTVRDSTSQAAAPGTSTKVAHADHVHVLGDIDCGAF